MDAIDAEIESQTAVRGGLARAYRKAEGRLQVVERRLAELYWLRYAGLLRDLAARHFPGSTVPDAEVQEQYCGPGYEAVARVRVGEWTVERWNGLVREWCEATASDARHRIILTFTTEG